jgi:large subunit ribosomal protein L32
MAEPKKKSSKTRTRQRRAHQALTKKNLIKCPKCNEYNVAHRVCMNCGYYKDIKVIDLDKKKTK